LFVLFNEDGGGGAAGAAAAGEEENAPPCEDDGEEGGGDQDGNGENVVELSSSSKSERMDCMISSVGMLLLIWEGCAEISGASVGDGVDWASSMQAC